MKSEANLLKALQAVAQSGAGRQKTLYAIRCRCGYTVALFAPLAKFVKLVEEHFGSPEHRERMAHPGRERAEFLG